MRRFTYVALFSLAFISVNVYAAKLPGHLYRDAMRLPNDTVKQDSTDEDDDKDRLFAFGVEYSTDQAQHGLHNDIKIPYIEPNFTYTAPKGFYIEVSDQYVLPKKISGFDAFCLNPGWDIDFGDNTTLNFNYTHYTFNPNSSNLVKSTLGNSLETYIEQWIGNLRGKFSIDYDIYKNKNTPDDISFTPDLYYKFKWKLGEKTAIKIKPEASVDFGTRNFYTQYLKAKEADSTAKKLKTKTTAIKPDANSSFGTLDYNLILTIDFAVGKFDFEPAYTYTDPLYKPSNVANPPTGYFSFSVTYTISTK